MGEVTKLGRSPGQWIAEEIGDMPLRACVVVYQDTDGRYGSADAGMSPEQLLMAAEILRSTAMSMVYGDDD